MRLLVIATNRLVAVPAVALTRWFRLVPPGVLNTIWISGIGFGFLVALILLGLHYRNQLAANREWMANVSSNDSTLSLADAFEIAHKAGVLRVELGVNRLPRINTGDCGERLLPNPPSSGRDTALKILCDTPQGNEVLAEIDQWNSSFELLALRDDFDRPSGDEVRCQTGDLVRFYIPLGCRDSKRHWTARLALNSANTGVLAATATGSAPFKDFAMLAEEHDRWMNDWMTIGPVGESASGQPYQIELTASLPNSIKRAVVHVIGNLHSIGADTNSQTITVDGVAGRNIQRMSFGQTSVVVRVLCKYTRVIFRGRSRVQRPSTAECKPGAPDDTPRAYVVTISTGGKVSPSIKLYASPRRAKYSATLRDGDDKVNRRWIIQRTANVAISCTKDLKECSAADFQLEWLPTTPHKDIKAKFDIADRNGVSLLGQGGQISTAALGAGLAPVVGLGPGDFGSLVWALNRTVAPPQAEATNVRLSIDLRLQSLVSEVLRRRVAESETRRAGGAAKRAAFILIDVSDAVDESGQMLAVASVPSVESGYNIWDLRALMEGNAASSPLLGHGWSAPDSAATPGSAFKAITALALIQRVLNFPADPFASMLTGVQANEAHRKLDVRPDPGDAHREALLVPINAGDPKCPDVRRCQPIRNAEGEKLLNAAFLRTAESKCPPSIRGVTAQIGLCEALITSSNLYFAGTARYLDEPKVTNPNTSGAGTKELAAQVRDLEVAAMARRFVCDTGRLSLLSSESSAIVRRAYRLQADPLRVAAVDAGTNRRQNVALSGFGQAVSATPLAMATIYGSIAAGRIIRPRLTVAAPVSQNKGPCDDVPSLLNSDDAITQSRYLNVLHRGLAGVVFSDSGTAHKYMPHRAQFADRLFAKTGTAQVKDADYTAWLVGWVEPRSTNAPSNRGPGISKRMAFACMVTNSKQNGGPTCGPIVDEIFAALEGLPPIAIPSPGRAKVLRK